MSHILKLGPVKRRHVHSEPNLAAREQIDQQLRTLDGDRDLRFFSRAHPDAA